MSDENTDKVDTTSTSARTADATPIVLRETTVTRLIFRPVLIENPGNPEAAIDGQFVFQRKTPSSEWVDVNDLPLSKLKATEWVKIDLKAGELLKFFQQLGAYYDLVSQHGVRSGKSQYVPAPKSDVLRALLQDDTAFSLSLADGDVAKDLLSALFKWLAGSQEVLSEALLDGIGVEDLQAFDALIAVARLEQFCQELDDNASNGDEGYWQSVLERFPWVIAQVYAIPLMIVHGQTYVGGKSLGNVGGNTADFLYANEISGNVVLVEIKTPLTRLTGPMYRNNVRNISADLAGATIQLLNAKRSLVENYRSLVDGDTLSSSVLSPRGLLIIGSQAAADMTVEGRSSFELFRNNQRDLEIVTFDEVRSKVSQLLALLRREARG